MKIKTILTTVIASLVVVAIVATALWASHVPDDTKCQQMKIVICDSADYQFVTQSELVRTLKRSNLFPLGSQMEHVSCHEIEQALLQHDMIRTAECCKMCNGIVRIKLTQRVPMLCVQTAEGTYYVDTDRKVMPVREHVKVQVPIFKGAVSKRSATEEYFDFAQWLINSKYWRDRIAYIHVKTPKDIVLHQREVAGNILLGNMADYEQKMNRLRKLYVDGFDEIGYTAYREFDLRYEGQVVGRK